MGVSREVSVCGIINSVAVMDYVIFSGLLKCIGLGISYVSRPTFVLS